MSTTTLPLSIVSPTTALVAPTPLGAMAGRHPGVPGQLGDRHVRGGHPAAPLRRLPQGGPANGGPVNDEGWEERMAARAKARREADWTLALPGHAEHEIRQIATARAAYIAEHGEHVTSAEPPGAEIDPEVCRECYEWRPIGNWPGIYGWRLACRDFAPKPPDVHWTDWTDLYYCGHEHHKTEVWIA